MRIINLEQGSPDWGIWRNTGIGSSDAPIILNGSHWGRDVRHLWREKTGKGEGARFNSSMRRGKRLEPVARALYEKWTGTVANPLCAVHDLYEWMKVSLDGWVNNCIVVEIKAPNAVDHRTALDDQVPEKYIPQLDHQLLVTGASTAHYVSYSNNFDASEQLAIVPYPAQASRLNKLLALELAFWQYVMDEVEPPRDLSQVNVA